jgi:phosphonate transport system permease protein
MVGDRLSQQGTRAASAEGPRLVSSIEGRLTYREPPRPGHWPRRLMHTGALLLVALLYMVSIHLAEIDPGKLWEGLPKMARWAAKAWPPATADLDALLLRAAETVAMALLGTTVATVLALAVCIFAARNLTPHPLVYYPARWLLNLLRGIDSFVFALLFVAAVGLGPFAGVLGVGLHTWGSMAKLFADAIETLEPGPLEAAALTGANRLKVIVYALLPDILPTMATVTLFWWEFNVRASTVLGVVGAGGIGQELKNSMDLLDFPRLLTILLIILAMVTIIDQLSAWLRRRLL